MEDWATVVLVLGSNAIMGVVNLLVTKKQIKHSKGQLEKQLQAQREADKRERQREVRSEPLVKLRHELARMAAKGERIADLAKTKEYQDYLKLKSEYGGWLNTEQVTNELTEALDDWNTYMASGELQQVLFMQYDVELVNRVDAIRAEYNRARYGVKITDWVAWLDEEAKKEIVEGIDQRISEAIKMIIENRDRIVEVQSKINELLDGL